MSLTNLAPTILLLGPLVNFWDGGGKGERFIQEIKPYIPRGVRDGGKFFVRLLEKIFKMTAMARIEGTFSVPEAVDDKSVTATVAVDASVHSKDSNGRDSISTVSSSSSVVIDATVPATINLRWEEDDSDGGELPEEEEQ